MEIQFFALAGGKRDRHMGESISPVADHHIGFARHGGVGGGLGEQGAEYGIFTFGTDTADGIAEVEIFEVEFHILFFEESFDFIFEQYADVFVQDISGSIFLPFFAGKEVLSGTFSDDDDGVMFAFHAFHQVGEQLLHKRQER